MQALKLIERLLQMGDVEWCGIYYHLDFDGLHAMFGTTKIQYCDGKQQLLSGREYVYDYNCEIGDKPNAILFVKNSSDEEENAIGLYLIEYPTELWA